MKAKTFSFKLNKLLLGIGATSLLFATSANVANANSNQVEIKPEVATTETIVSESQPMILAEVRDYCGPLDTLFSGETRGFWINVCGNSDPLTASEYVGVDKRNPSRRIRLPITDSDIDTSFYTAQNGNVFYNIANTPRGFLLVVGDDNREFVRQPFLDWIAPYSNRITPAN